MLPPRSTRFCDIFLLFQSSPKISWYKKSTYVPKMPSPWSLFNSVNQKFARRKTSNSIDPLAHCPLMSSDSTSRLGASSSVAAASALPLLSEAAAVSNTRSELLQQHRETAVRLDEENCIEDSSELHDQDQDFSDPSQHLLDVSLQHHHQQHQDFFDS